MSFPQNRQTGTAMVVTWTPDGGGAVTLSADYTNFSFDRSMDTVDATAGNETTRYHLGTIEGLEFTLTLYDALQTYKDDLKPGTTGALNIKPAGVGSGLPEYAFDAILTSYNSSTPFDGLVEIEISGMRLGAMTLDVDNLQA